MLNQPFISDLSADCYIIRCFELRRIEKNAPQEQRADNAAEFAEREVKLVLRALRTQPAPDGRRCHLAGLENAAVGNPILAY